MAPQVTTQTTEQIKILKFGAAWCQACRQLDGRKLLERFKGKHPEVGTLERIDVDKESARADEYNVESIPLVVFEDPDGLELARIEAPEDLDELEETFEKAQRKLKRVQNKKAKGAAGVSTASADDDSEKE